MDKDTVNLKHLLGMVSRQVKSRKQTGETGPTNNAPPVSNESPRFDYKRNVSIESGAYLVFECSAKLEAKSLTACTAAVLYHKFFKFARNTSKYDPYLFVAASLYLSGKENDEKYTLRDVANVCYHTIQGNPEPLGLGTVYYSLREAIVQAELLLLRAVRFDVSFPHAHKYLLYCLIALEQWVPSSQWNEVPISKMCWSLLHDFYVNPSVLNYQPEALATAIIYMALQCYAIQVPTGEDERKWYEVFWSGTHKEEMFQIIDTLMEAYATEDTLIRL